MGGAQSVYDICGHIPTIVTREGVHIYTHRGRTRWTFKPTSPSLEPGDVLPSMIDGDIVACSVDNEPAPVPATFARLDITARRLAIRTRPFVGPGINPNPA
jgi:hypothetical protein